MPTNTAATLTAISTSSTLATHTPIQQLPFFDDFTDPASGLVEESVENLVTYYSNDGFVMNMHDTNTMQLSPYALEFPPDVSIRAGIIHGESPDAALGLAFRVKNNDNFYIFMVDGRDNYWIIKVIDGRVQVLYNSYAPLRESEPLKIRKIRVDVRGHQIQVFDNRLLLTTLYDDALSSGTIGLIGWTADDPNRAIFQQIEVVAYQERTMPPSADCTLAADMELASNFSDDIRVVSFGPLGVDAVVNVTLRPGDVSLLLSAQTKDPEDVVMLGSISAPDGHMPYHLLDMETGEIASEMFAVTVQNEGEVTVFLPPAPEYNLQPGNYELVLYTYEGQPICDAVAVIRSGPVDGPQVIDLNIWVASQAVSLNTNEQRQFVETEIRTAIDNILNQHEMSLGLVTFIEARSEQKEEYARSDERSFASICQAVATAAGAGRAWNMALVDEYALILEERNEVETVFGMAALPGSVFTPGSLNSCGIVAWEPHDGDYNELGATIVHEGSHFLGMPHTTEPDGQTFDIFEDTPECWQTVYDDDNSGDVDDEECENADGNNYMFWISSGYNDRFVMSPDQAWALRRHPLFYSMGMTR